MLRAPYLMQTAFTVERQLPRNTTLAITYTNSHGLHILRSEDINAPLPGTLRQASKDSGFKSPLKTKALSVFIGVPWQSGFEFPSPTGPIWCFTTAE